MSILADTSGIISLIDQKDSVHEAVKRYSADLIVPASILCELDYLLSARFGSHVARAFLASIADNSLPCLHLDEQDIRLSYQLMERYADANIGFVDASILALASRYKLKDVLTLDRRHFSFVEAPELGYLNLLP